MFRRWPCSVNPYKRWLGMVLVAAGIVLVLAFVPMELWLVLLGAFCALVGVLLLK